MKSAFDIGLAVRRTFKWVGGALAGATIIASLCFGLYDRLVFQPRLDEIEALIARAPPQERSPPRALQQLERAEYGAMLPRLAARIVETELNLPRAATLKRAFREMVWTWLLRIHVPRDDLQLIVRSRLYLGDRAYGFSAGALGIFGRPLDELSGFELAQLVVISRFPTRWRERVHSKEVAEAARRLLRRAAEREG